MDHIRPALCRPLPLPLSPAPTPSRDLSYNPVHHLSFQSQCSKVFLHVLSRESLTVL